MSKWDKYKYLGFQKDVIKSCQSIIDRDNILILKNVTILLMLILAILVIFYSLFDRNNILRILLCIIVGMLLFGVYLGSAKILINESLLCTPRNTTIIISISMFICFACGIYLGTIAAPDQMAVAPIWMFFFAILIFNRTPLYNLITLIISAIVFFVLSFYLKSQFLFSYDVMHALTSIIASLYMSWCKTQMKIENISSLLYLERTNETILEAVEKKEIEAEFLRYQVSVDELTGFYKKENFEKIVTKILNQVPSQSVLVCIDIDCFKKINDNFGHMVGDIAIQDIVKEIEKYNVGNFFGRFGGDEFLIFAENVDDMDRYIYKLHQMSKYCQKEYTDGDKKQSISISYGYATYPLDGLSYVELFKKADEYLYEMKKKKNINR